MNSAAPHTRARTVIADDVSRPRVAEAHSVVMRVSTRARVDERARGRRREDGGRTRGGDDEARDDAAAADDGGDDDDGGDERG